MSLSSSKKVVFLFLFSLLFTCGIAQPIMRIGVIADIQYADIEPAGTRFYRNSLKKLEDCVAELNREKVDFSVNLGDLVDRNPADLEAIMSRLRALHKPFYNTPGNHDYEGVDNNDQLYQRMGMPSSYYSFTNGNWTFIMLNTNEVASYANIKGTQLEQEHAELIRKIKERGRDNDRPWNGGVSKQQLKWLVKQLKKAQRKGQQVMVFTHHPLYPPFGATALNDQEILETLAGYACVKGVISGHHHTGEFGVYEGIPCITTEGMIETADTNAYGILEIYPEKFVLIGKGRTKSYEWELKPKAN
ncbi:MAG: metallophosphoesterase [Spirosomataceae bacterium]